VVIRVVKTGGWKWFALVAKVLVALWVLVLVGGLLERSGSKVSVAALNLLIWAGLLTWANRRQAPVELTAANSPSGPRHQT
jgi:hypothetical protein